jgi:HAD superfamily hydrolase (TIGR01509 family)
LIRGLVFDFDGLIVDTESADYAAWREIYAELACELPFDRWSAGIGRAGATSAFAPLEYLEELLGHQVDREALRRRKRERYLRLVEKEPICAGVLGYIEDASRLGLRLGVATSSGDGWASGHLARLGLLQSFDCVRCGSDVAHAKPYPDVYLSVLECLELRPDEAIALEDSPSGAAAALAAGLFCVVVPNGMTKTLEFPRSCMRLESLTDLRLSSLLNTISTSRSASASSGLG